MCIDYPGAAQPTLYSIIIRILYKNAHTLCAHRKEAAEGPFSNPNRAPPFSLACKLVMS